MIFQISMIAFRANLQGYMKYCMMLILYRHAMYVPCLHINRKDKSVHDEIKISLPQLSKRA